MDNIKQGYFVPDLDYVKITSFLILWDSYSYNVLLSILFHILWEYKKTGEITIQAKLPDINAAIVRYRNNMLHAFDNGEINTVILSWSGINSLLPEDYQVEINTEKFNKLIAENKIIICDKCNERAPYSDIMIKKVMLSATNSFVTQKNYECIWECPKCNYENIFSYKQIKVVKYKEPYFLGVVPDVPERHFGIGDRSSFKTKFNKWFKIALDEIECKIGKYRADYIAQMEADDVKMGADEEHET